jgi:AcrR family transcriptional regulator
VVAETRSASPAWGRGRELLLAAARTLFAEQGYTATRTRQIAERASVTEPMLFRHFGSKAQLFAEAVLAPFEDYMTRYVTDWEHRPHGVLSPVQEARDFYRGLYDVLSEHRELVKALIAADVAQGPLAGSAPARPRLGMMLERFEQVIARERDDRGFHRFNPAIQARLMFGLVLSVAVMDDWMFDNANHPDSDNLINEMARITIHGAYDRPGHPSWDNDVDD